MPLSYASLSRRGRLVARYAGGLALAAVGAALTRWYTIDLVFGLSFLVGNALGVLAFFVLPFPANVFGTFLTMLPSLALWGHPWSLPAYFLEGLLVALLLRRGHYDKVLVAEGLYWLLVGSPLTAFLYHAGSGMSLGGAEAAAIKQGANAVVDAFIGVALYFAGRRIPLFASPSQRRQSGRENLVFLLDAILVVPLGAALLFYSANFRQIVITDIAARTDNVVSMIRQSLAEDNFGILRTVLKEHDYAALVISPSGYTIWSCRPEAFVNSQATARILAVHGSSSILGPARQTNPMRLWEKSVVRTRVDLSDGSTIFLQQAFGPHVEGLYRGLTDIFSYFLLILAAAGGIVYAAAAIFLRPLEHLRRTAEAIQLDDHGLTWPDKGIQEIRELRDSLMAMTGALATKEMELGEAKATAEHMMHRSERYTAFIAHEVKAPLSAVISVIEAAGDSPGGAESLLPLIGGQLRRLVELVEGILNQAAAGVEDGTTQKRVFALATEAEGTLAPFAIQARRKGLRFQSTIDPSLRRQVEGDPLRFRQVLANLVSNAIKYTGSGFVAVCLEVRSEGEACVVLGSVADSGRGIEAERLDEIWKPFASGSGRLADGQTSHGLGLSVVRRIVEGTGGSIRVESVEGRGSTFRFELRFGQAGARPSPPPASAAVSAAAAGDAAPLATLAAAAASPVAAAAAATSAAAPPFPAASSPLAAVGVPDLRSVATLVADDDRLSRMAIVHFLRKWGASVDEAEDGAQARRKVSEKAYDLVILDEHMPGANGADVAHILRDRELERGGRRAYVMMSSAEQAECFLSLVPSLVDAVATKPVSAEILGRRLAERFPSGTGKG